MGRDDRYVRNLEARIRELERKNEELVDRIMYLTGKPWTPPPVETTGEEFEHPEPPETDGLLGYTDDLTQVGL